MERRRLLRPLDLESSTLRRRRSGWSRGPATSCSLPHRNRPPGPVTRLWNGATAAPSPTRSRTEYTSSQTFWLEPGSSHFVFAPPSQSAPGARDTFVEWSDGGSFAHSILFSGAMSLEARFRAEYYLTVTSPFGVAMGRGWYDEGTIAFASLSSTSVPGAAGIRHAFVGWTGDANGAGTVSDGILMDGPKSATAVWRTEYFLQVDSDVGTVEGTGWYPAGE